MIPIYVIHIDSEIEREKFIKNQFEKLNIDFQFYPAVNAKQTPNHPLFYHYNAKKHFQRKGRTLSLGELGCFASHYSLWLECVDSNQPIIVLEDDVTILDNFKAIYFSLNSIIKDYDFLWLHKNYRDLQHVVIKNIEQGAIVKFYKDYFCAQGYVITPDAAKRLLDYCEEWIYPVDDQMARFYENKIENLAIYPPCIDQTKEIDSVIGNAKRGEKNLSFFSKLRREYFNFKDRCKQFIHNSSFKVS